MHSPLGPQVIVPDRRPSIMLHDELYTTVTVKYSCSLYNQTYSSNYSEQNLFSELGFLRRRTDHSGAK
jgi:hypothetical protein